MSSQILVVSGPTGSGKTTWAASMSHQHSVRLMNADAFQFYQEIPVLSNQPQEKNLWQFMAFQSLKEPLNAGEFGRISESALNERGILVGTGLYLGVSLYGFDDDRRKGVPFQGPPKRQYKAVVFNPDRKHLYQQLDLRVDEMLKAGALQEASSVAELINSGVVLRSNPVLKAIGLKHLLAHLMEKQNLETMIVEWKRDTRRLAKRQWTWLRKFMPPSSFCRWIDPVRELKEAETFLFK